MFSFCSIQVQPKLLVTWKQSKKIYMEFVEAFPDAEWDSISRMLNADHGLDYTPHLLPFSYEHDDNFVISSTFCSSLEPTDQSSFCSLDRLDSGLQYTFRESGVRSVCSSTCVSVPGLSHECNYINDCGDAMSADIYMAGDNSSSFALAFPDTSMEEFARVSECQLKRKVVDMPYLNTEGNVNLSENPNKPRVSKALQKSPKSKKTHKATINVKDEEENNVVQDPQSSSSCSSDDDEQTRVEPKTPSPPSMTVSGKTRASRGPATDPQSLYARKRREKINERLRILQTLVPNGTKVDISTMLEEAVQYVKFLQLQIKLLSSDDMWMYAPIAYNGMDIGLLNGRVSPTSL